MKLPSECQKIYEDEIELADGCGDGGEIALAVVGSITSSALAIGTSIMTYKAQVARLDTLNDMKTTLEDMSANIQVPPSQ